MNMRAITVSVLHYIYLSGNLFLPFLLAFFCCMDSFACATCEMREGNLGHWGTYGRCFGADGVGG